MPLSNDVTLSILGSPNTAGFVALAVTLDTFPVGWRPHDLETAYLPFAAVVGAGRHVQHRLHAAHPDERPAFPLDLDAFRKRFARRRAGRRGAQARLRAAAGNQLGIAPNVGGRAAQGIGPFLGVSILFSFRHALIHYRNGRAPARAAEQVLSCV
jgi:hypothetical protein